MDKKQLLQFQQTAEKISLEAGKILLKFRGRAQVVRSKRDFGDIVTEADEASEKHIISSLKKAFPSHCFLSEESGQTEKDSQYRWVIDPLDGTKEFARGVPQFSVNIALEYKHELMVGVTYFPATNELYSAGKRIGARLNGKAIGVSSVDTFDKATVFIHPPRSTDPSDVFDKVWGKMYELAKRLYRVKTGSHQMCYCCWIALGAYEAFWFPVKHATWWDFASQILIVQEAGGKVTTGKGNRVTELNFKKEGIVATNGKIHDQLLAIIQS